MIKIFGLEKCFTVMMGCISQALFKEWKDKAKKKASLAIQGVRKMQNDLILVQKVKCMDMIKIWGLLKGFALVMWCICGAFSSKFCISS